MKKKNLKSLTINKKSISNLQYHQLQGGYIGTEDITNCGALCAQDPPKTIDSCDDTFGTETGETYFGNACAYCDVNTRYQC